MLAFERLAEEKIRDAIAAGEFDRLPGKGKPLVWDEPFGLRPEDRIAHTVLKNSGYLPEHLEWRKELEKRLTELEHFRAHCGQRLGKILSRLASSSYELPRHAGTPKHNSRLRQIMSLSAKREQNSTSRRGKGGLVGDSTTKLMRAWRQPYLDERRQLRVRMCELFDRAEKAAQQVQQALVEKEIRERRPLVFLLGNTYISGPALLAQFDREFPATPWENENRHDQFQLDAAGAAAA